jgi:hypothetical protein
MTGFRLEISYIPEKVPRDRVRLLIRPSNDKESLLYEIKIIYNDPFMVGSLRLKLPAFPAKMRLAEREKNKIASAKKIEGFSYYYCANHTAADINEFLKEINCPYSLDIKDFTLIKIVLNSSTVPQNICSFFTGSWTPWSGRPMSETVCRRSEAIPI